MMKLLKLRPRGDCPPQTPHITSLKIKSLDVSEANPNLTKSVLSSIKKNNLSILSLLLFIRYRGFICHLKNLRQCHKSLSLFNYLQVDVIFFEELVENPAEIIEDLLFKLRIPIDPLRKKCFLKHLHGKNLRGFLLNFDWLVH